MSDLTANEAPSVQETHKEHEQWQFAKWTLQVLYSPLKTFGEIANKPNIKGPILILLIALPIVLVGQYVSGTKFFLETPVPRDDAWTETLFNSSSFSWSSNGELVLDSNSYLAGNHSILTSLNDSSQISASLSNIPSLNFSERESPRLYVRLQWLHEANATPTQAILRLFSFHNESRTFQADIEDMIATSASIWANISIPLVNGDWTPYHSPSWANITGVGFQLSWDAPADIALLVDELRFGTFAPFASEAAFNVQLAYSLVQTSVDFLLQWLLLSGIATLALKSFSAWKGSWKNLISTLGYAYSVSIIYYGALIPIFLLLPRIFLPHRITYEEYLTLYQGSWGLPVSLLSLVHYVWITILCAIALRKTQELSWGKAFLIGFTAFIMSILFSSLLLSAFP